MSQFQPSSEPHSPRSTRPSSPMDSSFAGNDTTSPVTPLTPSLLFANLAFPLASSEPALSPSSISAHCFIDSSSISDPSAANAPVASIRVIIPSSPSTARANITSPSPSSRNRITPNAAAAAPYGQSYPPRPSSANSHHRPATLAQRVLNPPSVHSSLFDTSSALLATAPSSSLPKLEDPLIPLPAFTSEAHPPRSRRWATEDPTLPGVHPVADYLYNSSLLASSLIHSSVPHNLGLVRRASSTGHLPLLLVPSRFTSIPTTPISKEAWLASQGRLPLPTSDSEANGHLSDTGSVRTAHSHHSRRTSRTAHPPKSSSLGGSRRGSVASKKSLAPSSKLRHKRPRRPISPGASSAGPYSADDDRDAVQAADSDNSSAEDRYQTGEGTSRGYATFAPTWLVDDEALGVSDRSSPDNGLGSSKDWAAGPSPMVLGPAVATKVANQVYFNGILREHDPEADLFEVESEGENAPLLGGRQPYPLRSRRAGPPPPHRLLLLVFLLAGATAVIVLVVFLVYASTHPLTSFKIRVGSTQFLWTNPVVSAPSTAAVGIAMRRRRSSKPAVVLDGFQLSLNVSGFNKNFMSDIALRQDQPLSVVLVEWRGPLLSTTTASEPSPESADRPPFTCDSIPAMSRSPLGVLSLHKHKHQFTFPPGASSKWTVAANIRHPRADDEDLYDKDPVWHRYRTNAQPAYSYYLAIHGAYAYSQAWVVEREVPVCVIHSLPPAPAKAATV